MGFSADVAKGSPALINEILDSQLSAVELLKPFSTISLNMTGNVSVFKVHEVIAQIMKAFSDLDLIENKIRGYVLQIKDAEQTDDLTPDLMHVVDSCIKIYNENINIIKCMLDSAKLSKELETQNDSIDLIGKNFVYRLNKVRNALLDLNDAIRQTMSQAEIDVDFEFTAEQFYAAAEISHAFLGIEPPRKAS
jgi:hypothetical protein